MRDVKREKGWSSFLILTVCTDHYNTANVSRMPLLLFSFSTFIKKETYGGIFLYRPKQTKLLPFYKKLSIIGMPKWKSHKTLVFPIM